MTIRRLPIKAQSEEGYYEAMLYMYQWLMYFVDVFYWYVFYFLDLGNFWAGLFGI